MTDDAAAGLPAADPLPEGYVGDPTVLAEWDARYADHDQMWSGRPNGALVAEIADLTPGRVLDVGCGEGADAVWLASTGWDVTALEVSGVALERAAQHARDAGVSVRWVHAEMARASLPPGSFDLVTAQYPVLQRTPDAAAERALLAAVAPGGVLLVVHHAGMDTHGGHDAGDHGHDHGADAGHGGHDDHDGHGGHGGHGVHDSQGQQGGGDERGEGDGPGPDFDPADYVWPAMIAALLDDDWVVEVDEQRPRVVPESGVGAHHVDDVVLRARRLR